MTKLAQLAIDHINATSARAGEWVYYDDASQEYWVATDQDLEALGADLESGVEDAYSLWCSAGYGRKAEATDLSVAGIVKPDMREPRFFQSDGSDGHFLGEWGYIFYARVDGHEERFTEGGFATRDDAADAAREALANSTTKPIEQVLIESSSAFGGTNPYTVERDQDGTCVVCPSDDETLAVQVYEAGEWRDALDGEEVAEGTLIRWGDGFGYPWVEIEVAS